MTADRKYSVNVILIGNCDGQMLEMKSDVQCYLIVVASGRLVVVCSNISLRYYTIS